MGRTTTWISERRPALVELLSAIERGSSVRCGHANRGGRLLMLENFAAALYRYDGRPRSVNGMRQAWWRWTTDNDEQASIPSVGTLAVIVRCAKHHGWLEDITAPTCLELVERLMGELEKTRAAEKNAQERSWTPEARKAVLKLFAFLETRLTERADDEAEEAKADGQEVGWGIGNPLAYVVQEEATTMFEVVIDQLVLGLKREREVFCLPDKTDTLIQPFEGWSETLRKIAADLTKALNEFADEVESAEESLYPESRNGNGHKRVRMLPQPTGRKSAELSRATGPTG